MSTRTLQAWVAHFFQAAGLADMSRQMQVVEAPTYSITTRVNSTVHMTFTYDEGISLETQDEPLRAC